MSHEPRNHRPRAHDRGAGAPERLSPERGRAILDARFAAAGVQLARGCEIEVGGAALVLDAFDARRAVGYVYLPADRDDPARADAALATARALSARAAQGRGHVLCVFQDDMPTAEVLERRIDAFFASLPR